MQSFERRGFCITAAWLTLFSTGVYAQSLNVQFTWIDLGFPEYTNFTGTAMAPDTGTVWNQVGRFEDFWPNMKWSDGTVTGTPGDPEDPGISVTVFGWSPPGDIEVTFWTANGFPTLAPQLFSGYLYAFNHPDPAVNCCENAPIPVEDLGTLYPMTIQGLDPSKEYDIYLYSQNSAAPDASHTRFFVDGESKDVIAPNYDPSQGPDPRNIFVNGENWTSFSKISPTVDPENPTNGIILVEYLDIKGQGAAFNGFQLIEHVSGFNTVDLDQDGDVDGRDFLLIQRTDPSLIPLWQEYYGTSPLSAVHAIPEPASAVLMLAGLVGCSGAFRRRRNASATKWL